MFMNDILKHIHLLLHYTINFKTIFVLPILMSESRIDRSITQIWFLRSPCDEIANRKRHRPYVCNFCMGDV